MSPLSLMVTSPSQLVGGDGAWRSRKALNIHRLPLGEPQSCR